MELIFDFFLMLLFIGMLLWSNGIAATTIRNDHMGSAGFPRLIAVAAIVLLTITIGKKVLALVRASQKVSQTNQPTKATQPSRDLLVRTLSLITFLLLYIGFLKHLGFVLETMLFIFICLFILGERKYFQSFLFSLGLTALLVIVFGRIFFIALPRGTGWLREISYFLF